MTETIMQLHIDDARFFTAGHMIWRHEDINNLLYVMFIDKGKDDQKINKAMGIKHVEYVKNLDESGKLELCGAFKVCPHRFGIKALEHFQ